MCVRCITRDGTILGILLAVNPNVMPERMRDAVVGGRGLKGGDVKKKGEEESMLEVLAVCNLSAPCLGEGGREREREKRLCCPRCAKLCGDLLCCVSKILNVQRLC